MISARLDNQTHNEKLFVAAYSVFAFLAGMYITAFDINVHSLFFTHFGYKYLSTTYILGGLLGMIIIYVFTLIYKLINTKSLTFIIISAIVLFTGTYLLLELVWPIKWIYYYGMVVFFPVNIMLVITLWRYGRKLLSPVYTRKIFPVVKFMFFAGIAVAGSGYTLGLFFYRYEGLIFLTLVSLIAMWFSVPVLNYFFSKLTYNIRPEEKYIPVNRDFFLFFTSKYTRLLFFFTLLSAMVGYSVHFVFINMAWVEFGNIIGMSKFYGLYTAVSVVFLYGIDRYLIKRILYSNDSPYSLVLLAPLMFLSVVLTLLVPLFISHRFSGEHFTLVLLLIIICKIGYLTLNLAVQTPSLRTLFYTLDLRYRQVAYPRMEGSVVMAGLTIAGSIFLGLSFLKFFSISIVLIFSAILCLLWFWSGIKLVRNYSKIMEAGLSKMRIHRYENESSLRIDEHLEKIFSSKDSEKTIEALKISSQIRPFEFENELKRLISHPSPKVRKFVLENIEKRRIVSVLDDLKSRFNDLTGTDKEQMRKTIEKLEWVAHLSVTEQLIKDSIYSGSIEERLDLTYALSNSEIQDKEALLLTLIKDSDVKVQNAAFRVLSKSGSGEYCYTLIDYLYPGQYNAFAFDAIAASKEKAIDFLERESLLPHIDDKTLSRIIKLYGKIGTGKAVELLFSRMGEIDSHVLMHSIQALVDNRFQAGKDDKLKILSHIVKIVGFITYNLTIVRTLKNKPKLDLLCYSYELEIAKNYSQLFKMLTLIYNPNIIASLEKLFMKGNREAISHGIEQIDYYIDDDIKPLILPLFEDISLTERLKKLEYYFPQSKKTIEEIISLTLTYDFNALSLYPRACAIILIDELRLDGFDDELVFCSNHPDVLLSETAQHLLHKNKTKAGLGGNLKKEPAKSVLTEYSLFYKCHELILNKSFSLLSEDVLIELAKSMTEYELNPGEVLQVNKLITETSLILSDTKYLNSESNVLISNNLLFYIPLLNSMGITELSTEKKCSIKAFDTRKLNELLHDNPDLVSLILTVINNLQTGKKNEQ